MTKKFKEEFFRVLGHFYKPAESWFLTAALKRKIHSLKWDAEKAVRYHLHKSISQLQK